MRDKLKWGKKIVMLNNGLNEYCNKEGQISQMTTCFQALVTLV